MPEIWLGYGESEIILDIKYENLAKNLKPEFTIMDPETLEVEITNRIMLKDSTLILVINPFISVLPILEYLQKKNKESQFTKIEFNTISKVIPYKARKKLAEKQINLTKLDDNEILEKISKFDNAIVIDKIEYDPFFGYTGVPVKLLRSCYPAEMNRAYSLLIDKPPQAGSYSEQLRLAVEKTKNLNVEAINVIADNTGINSIFTGDMESSFNQSIEQFKKLTQPSCDIFKSAFISGNSNFVCQNTLGESLNLLWNNYHAVREQGTVILLSENRGGVGEGALLKHIEGRLKVDEFSKNQYLRDLEHINFLNVLGDKYEIILISTIPLLYLNKLGLKAVSKIQDALKNIIEKYGKYSKSLVINNSEITLVNGYGRKNYYP